MIKASTEGLIWLVVGIFWIIAQIFQSAAQKKQKEQQRRETEEARDDELAGAKPGAAESFAELVRRLSGEQEPLVQPPEWIEVEEEEEDHLHPEEPVQAVRSEAAWSRREIDQLPDIKPVRRAPAPPPSPHRTNPPEDAAQHLRPKLSDFRTSTPIIKLPSMILRMSSPTLATVSSDRSHSATAPDLRRKRVLRRAMLGHVILGKPRALDPLISH